MRFVFEFHGKKPTASASGDAYHPRGDQPPPEWPGFQAEVNVCAGWQPGEVEGDHFTMEGDGAAIKKALSQALAALDLIEQHSRCTWAARRALIKTCPTCATWVETRAATGAFLPHPRPGAGSMGYCPGGEPPVGLEAACRGS